MTPDARSIRVANFAMATQRSSTVLPPSPDKFGLNGRGEQVDARGTPREGAATCKAPGAQAILHRSGALGRRVSGSAPRRLYDDQKYTERGPR